MSIMPISKPEWVESSRWVLAVNAAIDMEANWTPASFQDACEKIARAINMACKPVEDELKVESDAVTRYHNLA